MYFTGAVYFMHAAPRITARVFHGRCVLYTCRATDRGAGAVCISQRVMGCAEAAARIAGLQATHLVVAFVGSK